MQSPGILTGKGSRKGLGMGCTRFTSDWNLERQGRLGKSLDVNYGRVNTSPFVTGLVVLRWPVCSWEQSLAALCFRYFCRLVNSRLHFPHWNRSGSLSSPSDSCPAEHKRIHIIDHLRIAQRWYISCWLATSMTKPSELIQNFARFLFSRQKITAEKLVRQLFAYTNIVQYRHDQVPNNSYGFGPKGLST